MSNFYHTKQWRKVRKLVLEKYFYVCQECEGEADMVHHIVEIKDDPTLSLTFSNLLPLCNSCHNKIHDRMNGTLRAPIEQTNDDGLSGDWV